MLFVTNVLIPFDCKALMLVIMASCSILCGVVGGLQYLIITFLACKLVNKESIGMSTGLCSVFQNIIFLLSIIALNQINYDERSTYQN